MSTYNTDVAAIQAAPTPATLLESGAVGGKVRLAIAKYTGVGTEAAASVINLVKLPKGARVLPISHIQFEAGQNADLGIKVGDDDTAGVGAAADDNRYLVSSTVGASAVKVDFSASANVGAAAVLTPYKLGAEAWIQAVTEGQTFAAADFTAYIFYTLE